MHSEYIRENETAKNAVLMIHGICSTPRHFDFLTEEFGEEWSVYNILLDGHGGSVKDFAHSSMAKWKKQTCDMLDMLSEKYDGILLVGYSMGTLLEIEAVSRYPKVKGMLLLNVPMYPRVSLRMFFRSLRLVFGRCRCDDPHENACKNDASIELTANLFKYITWIPRFIELLALCRDCRLISGTIAVPTAAFFGKRDELVSLRSVKCFKDSPAVRVTVFERAGHFYFYPDDVSRIKKELHVMMDGVK